MAKGGPQSVSITGTGPNSLAANYGAGPSAAPQGGAMPGVMDPMAGLGIDPQMMRQIMAMQFLSSAANNIGSMGALQRGGYPTRPTAQQQSSPLANIIPMLQIQAYGEAAKEKANKLAKDTQRDQAYYGMYAPETGGKPWQVPGNEPIYSGPSSDAKSRILRTTPEAGEASMGGGMVNQSPAALQPFLRAMTPEKGMATLASIIAEQMKPETFGQPVSSVGPDGKPAFLQIGNRGTPREVGGGFAPMDKNPITRELKIGDKIVTQEFQNGAWKNIAEAPRESKSQSGPFAGTGMDAQSYNIVLSGDPNSAEYRAAYAQLAQPKVTIDPNTMAQTVIRPDMSWARQPGGTQLPPPTQTGGEASPVGVGGTVPMPSGVTAPSGRPSAMPAQTFDFGGATATVTPGGPSATERQKLNSAIEGAATLVNALDDYKSSFTDAGLGERAASVAGMNTPLNTSFSNAALLAKGEELYNLGVLNGPDLDIIRRTLADPSTVRGAATDSTDVSASVKKVTDLIQNRISAKQMQMGLPVTNIIEHAAKIRAAVPGAGSMQDAARQEIERRKRAGEWGR